MHHYKKTLSFIIFLILFLKPFLVLGETFSYEEIINTALKYSPRLKEKAYEMNIANAVYKQSLSYFYPQISLSTRTEKFENLAETTGFIIVGGQVIGGQPDEWRTGLYLTAEYYISNLYKRWFDTSYYRLLKEVTHYDCRAEVKRLLKDITDLYAKIIEGKIKLKYSELILDKLKEIHSLEMVAYEKGEVSYEDLLKTEAEIEAALKEQTNIRRELKVYLSDLSWITGKRLTLEDNFLSIPAKGEIHEIEFSGRITDLSEYKAQLKQIRAFEERLKSVKMSYLPDIIFYARYDLYGSSLDTFGDALGNVEKTAFTTGIFITLPLFDGGRIKWEKMRTLYELERQKERLKSIEIEKGREIDNFYLTYKETKDNLRRYKNLLEYYKKLFYIEKRAYELGEKSKIELLQIEKDLLSLERDTKITENTLASLEKKIEIELSEGSGYAGESFVYYRACKY